MRKITVIILSLILLLISACSGQPVTQAPATPIATETFVAPTPELTLEPTSEPTQASTLSPKEIEAAKNMEEYERLKSLYENYYDEYALFFIKDMVDAGKITEKLLTDLKDPFYFGSDKNTWDTWKEVYAYWSNILNIRQGRTIEGELGDIVSELHRYSSENKALISLFDEPDERKRLMDGIDIINVWCENPTDENRAKMEAMYFGNELNPGEVIFLVCWYWSNPLSPAKVTVNGKTYKKEEYLSMVLDPYNKSIEGRYLDAFDKVIELNNALDIKSKQ